MPTSPDTPPQGPSAGGRSRKDAGISRPVTRIPRPPNPRLKRPPPILTRALPLTPKRKRRRKRPRKPRPKPLKRTTVREATDQKEPQYVTVTVDGKSERIPLEEVVKGYLRQQDYTR